MVAEQFYIASDTETECDENEHEQCKNADERVADEVESSPGEASGGGMFLFHKGLEGSSSASGDEAASRPRNSDVEFFGAKSASSSSGEEEQLAQAAKSSRSSSKNAAHTALDEKESHGGYVVPFSHSQDSNEERSDFSSRKASPHSSFIESAGTEGESQRRQDENSESSMELIGGTSPRQGLDGADEGETEAVATGAEERKTSSILADADANAATSSVAEENEKRTEQLLASAESEKREPLGAGERGKQSLSERDALLAEAAAEKEAILALAEAA
ncbi:unnamed protein product, partial [Amoebophrya sp. A25]|eukprot:GSA25T00006218001.1